MKKFPLVSVIMPVYKVEDYVEKTIVSVLNQTYKNIEFFAIDDGSPDCSGQICEKFAKLDSRLKVIHQKNAGAPAARNAAIKIAQGEYFYFIDSDDYIEENMISEMVKYAQENSLDLVVTGFKMEYYQTGKDITYETKCPKIIKEIDEFKKIAHNYLNNSLLSLPWNKLYSGKIIRENSLFFPNTKWDDHHFNMDYLMHANKIGMLDICMYHWYRSRKGSETMINYTDPNMFEKRVEHFQHILKLYKTWDYMDNEIQRSICSYFAGRVIQCIQEIEDNNHLEKKKKKQKVFQILHSEYTVYAFKYAKLSKKFKVVSMPMKRKNVSLSLFNVKMINILRKFFPKIFIKLKEKEVHES